jgi:hypothetical protein
MVVAVVAEPGAGANACLGRAALEAGDVLEPDTHLCNAKMSRGLVSFRSALGKEYGSPSISSASARPEARARRGARR